MISSILPSYYGLSHYSWDFSFFCRMSSFVRAILSWRGFPVLREKLEPHPQWVLITPPEAIHFFPTFVIRISSKKSPSIVQVWKVIPPLWNPWISVSGWIHSTILIFCQAHHFSIRKHETSVMPRVCQSRMLLESNIILESEKYSCCCKSDNTTCKCLYRCMSDRFVKCFTIIWSQYIQCLRMETCLESDIHRIINDDDGKYETDKEHITPRSVFDTHRCRESDDESRMSRRHTTTSKHIREAKAPLRCMDGSLHDDSHKKSYKRDENSVWIEICLELIKHKIRDYRDSMIR